MENLITQRMVLMTSTEKPHIDGVYDHLQQDNMKLQKQIQDLTRELRRTVSAITPTFNMNTHNDSSLSTNGLRPKGNYSDSQRPNTQTTETGNNATEAKNITTDHLPSY